MTGKISKSLGSSGSSRKHLEVLERLEPAAKL